MKLCQFLPLISLFTHICIQDQYIILFCVFYISGQYCNVHLILFLLLFLFFFLLTKHCVLRFYSALICEIEFKTQYLVNEFSFIYMYPMFISPSLYHKICPQFFAAVSVLECVILCILCRIIFVMYS